MRKSLPPVKLTNKSETQKFYKRIYMGNDKIRRIIK